MPLVSSLILPHGAMVFDGGEGCTAAAAKRIQQMTDSLRGDCQTLFKSSCEAAELAKRTKPEVIFLNTPHGVCLSSAHCVYLNPTAKGNAEWNGQWTEYDVNMNLDSELAKAFLTHLREDGIPAEGMVAYTACEAPLRWGEVIPLWFFRDLTASGVKVVIFSNPLTRYKEMSTAEVTEVGRSISKFLSGLDQRVLYVVSGDLAHTHQTYCSLPLYLPDPRWNMPTSDTAIPFDVCVENWVKGVPYSPDPIQGPLKTKEKELVKWDSTACHNGEQWLSRAIDMKQTARSCGIYGSGVLHGILSAKVEKNVSFTAHHFCRLAPTYYGMVVAAFIENS